nr:hypothetical protein Iba_chr11bCG13750 [Ipomoea batatas]
MVAAAREVTRTSTKNQNEYSKRLDSPGAEVTVRHAKSSPSACCPWTGPAS